MTDLFENYTSPWMNDELAMLQCPSVVAETAARRERAARTVRRY